jgi:hypothetical protein
MFGEFDASWDKSSHDIAFAYGFYIKTEGGIYGNGEEYSIVGIDKLSKINE